MNGDWTISPGARRVAQHATDPRPAWLWSQDGRTLLWHNEAATLFLAKLKKHGLKLAAPAVPIKGQVARNIRLGSPGRTSLARVQFLAGDKPASSTCATTPLDWHDGQTALLIVGVDPVAADVLAAAAGLHSEDAAGEDVATVALPDAGADLGGVGLAVADETASARSLDDRAEAGPDPIEIEAPAEGDQAEPEDGEAQDSAPSSRLSRLVEQLASDQALFTPLTDADDRIKSEDAERAAAGLEAFEVEAAPVAGLEEAAAEFEGPSEPEMVLEPADADSVERVSRYNFDELSRILNDRVLEPVVPAVSPRDPQRGGALINLGGETLVLNRLPLGILVFRDQQVLFANRAITEMVGYNSVESLRTAGLAAVFPAAGPDGQEAGPVNHLVQRDGTLVPVTARLQSISWQGRPALMLSASATEVRTGHEAAVRAFAEATAELRGEGFFEATRSGVISAMSPAAATLLGGTSPLEGKPLSAFVGGNDIAALRAFLERPARFAESERPYLMYRAGPAEADIVLFAQGQAGVVTNYFGLVRGREQTPARLAAPSDADPALLARISRGVRRPLNTIIGFAELLRTQAFGGQQDKPFEGYAQDIATAGQDIAALVDELDNYARLRDGRYLPQRSSIELTSLLESCVIRIRPQANAARVIVRNAIAENLPHITADRLSLEQAVLNLLASAIDQSPTGGAVVISAKHDDEGGIAVHVRDSSNNAVDMAERFVVFRDGVGRDGQMLAPVRSSVGLALTRSLLAVNTFSLSVDPAGERGLLFTLLIPADLAETPETPKLTD